MTAGIDSQYGFLYQRYVFIKVLLDNVGMNNFFTYEGKDDIDIIEKDKIMTVATTNNMFIQVKSGTVSRECWAKIIGNWLLMDGYNDACFNLVLENKLAFEKTEAAVINDVYEFFLEGGTKRSTSIANKVYNKFIAGKTEDSIKNLIKRITKNTVFTIKSLVEIKADIYEKFASIYCTDIKIYEIAKRKRLERFEDYVNRNIDNAFEKKKPYTLRYQDFISIISEVSSEVSDTKYNINTADLKKRKQSDAKRMLESDNIREVRQLRLVKNDDGFIVSQLVKELLYKDLRSVYAENGGLLISNMEDIAYTNYQDTCFELPEDVAPSLLFKETMKKPIPSSIVDNNTIYRYGCYIFLTSDDVNEEMKISWGKENEKSAT